MIKSTRRKSIFRSLFVPMIIIMVLQAAFYYIAAMYGGIDESLSKNAVDVVKERTNSRKNELESKFNGRWSDLDDCQAELDSMYSEYELKYGENLFVDNKELQIAFLKDSGALLINALRYSRTNGIFLILNDRQGRLTSFPESGDQKYGILIRDIDSESNYNGNDDLLLERSPSSVVDSLDCVLDSGWEAKYNFKSEKNGDFYYEPLNASYNNKGASGRSLSYISYVHQPSGSGQRIISYSIPLVSENGTPYAVLGVEISEKYISSLLPSRELIDDDKGSYCLCLRNSDEKTYIPLASSGSIFTRCFGDVDSITAEDDEPAGGFDLTGRDGTRFVAVESPLIVYDNNNPFESRQLVLLSMVERDKLFSYISQISTALMVVVAISLTLGVAALIFVSKRFASPITALANRVRSIEDTGSDYRLGRVGIDEIDRLVESIEELNRNVNKNSARTEFFSRMSHDMRTPMNAIISFSSPELLENADENQKTDYFEKIHGSGIYLLGLINEVLDMTKIENNSTELHLTAVKADSLFITPVNMMRELSQKKNQTFITPKSIPENLAVMADVQHLDQIVMNLLSNAVKFTPEGGTVSFSVDISNDGDTRILQIVTADTGIGMSESFIKNLYKPFEQENGLQGGTGLGLSIAKKLTELMSGTIECESQQNIGTTFTVRIPLPCAENALLSETQDDIEFETSVLRGKKILVCEDNSINASIVEALLNRVGAITVTAEDGQKGTQAFWDSAPGEYSAVLMDIRMPVMDGFTATEVIRNSGKADAKTIPVIAMTADAFARDKRNSLDAGMNEHLSKPVEPQKLYNTLSRLIAENESHK